MLLAPINDKPIATKQINFQGRKNPYEKDFGELIKNSKIAMHEMAEENFNSQTLRTLFSPDFRPQNPGCMMAVSTQNPGKPVEIAYKKTTEMGANSEEWGTLDFFTKEAEENLLGKSQYLVKTNPKGKKEMIHLYISSEEEACKKAGIKGIGIIEDILHIKEAIGNKVESLPCTSYAKSVLFHLKMGFRPVQELKKVYTPYGIEDVMKESLKYSNISSKNYTPILVSKGLFNKEYFLDVNASKCASSLRQIKQNYADGLCNDMRPYVNGQCVKMVLDGENFNIWKNMIKKAHL